MEGKAAGEKRALGVLLWALLAAPAAAAPKTIVRELGREFTLRKTQRAKLAGTDASILVAGFINSPCPKGARCVWSGQTVLLELTVAGATVPLNGSAPYEVKILATDYKISALLRVDRRPRVP